MTDAFELTAGFYRTRVREVMSSPVITCTPEETLETVSTRMTQHNISSVVVVDRNTPVGIITEKDLVSRVLACGLGGDSQAGQIMSRGLVWVSAEDFIYRALLLMVKNRIKHLVVLDGGILKGMLTIRDLVRESQAGVLTIVDEIETQTSLEGLNRARKLVDKVLYAMVADRANAFEICEVVSELNDHLSRRIINDAEREMVETGYGSPPVAYAWLTLGSGGRKEQTLRTDQDNALVFEDPPDPRHLERIDSYFSELAARVVGNLVRCGFPVCQGGVMASNAEWRRPLKNWREAVLNWVGHPEPYNLRHFSIFLDFRAIYGDLRLAESLRSMVLGIMLQHGGALRFMAEDNMAQRVRLGVFGGFPVERSGPRRGELDLKSTVSVHIVDCVRILALKEGIRATPTRDRIRALAETGSLSGDDAEVIESAFETITMFRIKGNLNRLAQGGEPDNYIDPAKLSRLERTRLTEAYVQARRLQNLTANRFVARVL